MTEKLQVYKCEVCGNIVEMVHEGKGELVCCGKPMKLIVENTVDAAREKHVPVVEKIGTGFKVKVGSVAHPMEEKHYVEWIEVIAEKLAQKCGSKLHIFHTLKIPIGGKVSYPREQIEKEVADAKEKLQKTYGDKVKEIDHSFDVWEGDPLVEIPKYARINEIDLINMGSHAREQEKRWYLGSVVEKVSLESYCPVITVTRPEALLKFEE